MNIVYYTSGITGIGRLIIGIAIGNALARKAVKCNYTIVHSSRMGHVADDFNNIKVPIENEVELSKNNFRKATLYKTLIRLKPDILIVNHQWFMLYNFINDLQCKKLYLSDYAYEKHFKISLPDGEMIFNPEHYDRVLAIEPFSRAMAMEQINPLILRNRDEIFSREKALQRLGLDGSKKIALYSFSGNPGEFERHLQKYSFLENEYDVVRLSLYNNFLYPIVDYYNAFDIIVSGGGYNNVWSSVFFQKQSIFEPTELKFSDHETRINLSRDFHFDVNGADQLADIIMGL